MFDQCRDGRSGTDANESREASGRIGVHLWNDEGTEDEAPVGVRGMFAVSLRQHSASACFFLFFSLFFLSLSHGEFSTRICDTLCVPPRHQNVPAPALRYGIVIARRPDCE